MQWLRYHRHFMWNCLELNAKGPLSDNDRSGMVEVMVWFGQISSSPNILHWSFSTHGTLDFMFILLAPLALLICFFHSPPPSHMAVLPDTAPMTLLISCLFFLAPLALLICLFHSPPPSHLAVLPDTAAGSLAVTWGAFHKQFTSS